MQISIKRMFEELMCEWRLEFDKLTTRCTITIQKIRADSKAELERLKELFKDKNIEA